MTTERWRATLRRIANSIADPGIGLRHQQTGGPALCGQQATSMGTPRCSPSAAKHARTSSAVVSPRAICGRQAWTKRSPAVRGVPAQEVVSFRVDAHCGGAKHAVRRQQIVEIEYHAGRGTATDGLVAHEGAMLDRFEAPFGRRSPPLVATVMRERSPDHAASARARIVTRSVYAPTRSRT